MVQTSTDPTFDAMLEKARAPANKQTSQRSSGLASSATRRSCPFATMSAKPVLLAWLLVATSALADDSALPDPTLTPGQWNTEITVQQLRRIGYSRQARHVSIELRREVFARYGIEWAKRNDYEVDHLCPLAIGGSNDIKNLWPEKLRLNVNGKDLGAITKDRVERKLESSEKRQSSRQNPMI
jgi:hypothetical protein